MVDPMCSGSATAMLRVVADRVDFSSVWRVGSFFLDRVGWVRCFVPVVQVMVQVWMWVCRIK